MKTTLDTVDIVWSRLDASPLKAEITGGIFKHQRPTGSVKEDVVINGLPINNLQVQSAIVNVNIHVPALFIDFEGTQTQQPDNVRLNELSVLAIAALSDVWSQDYNYDVQQQILIMDTDPTDFYVNIRLEFFNINISN